MKTRLLITTLIILCASTVFAQSDNSIPIDTLFFNKQKTLAKSQNDIAYYRFVYRTDTDSIYKVEDYYINGQLQVVGFYKTHTHILLRTITSQVYRHGEFSYYNSNGELTLKEKYENGISIGELRLTPPPDSAEIRLKSSVLTFVERMPEPKYDVRLFIAQNLEYPESAKLDRAEGRVNIRFVVDEEGDIIDIEHVGDKMLHVDLVKAALLVVSKFPRWKPGILNGKPVKVYYTLPVTFKLQ
ncbi:MAG: energy transducer TonB [Chitinophagales bacterium]|nr:energy transducer TonB [Chitinophagaceae bacterium]MCB9065701.1 energy transducer TonB [Chitinophagales bacterium]